MSLMKEAILKWSCCSELFLGIGFCIFIKNPNYEKYVPYTDTVSLIYRLQI